MCTRDFTTPLTLDTQARVEMTVSCKDSDLIPKVEKAGEVFQVDGESIQIMHNGLRVLAGGYYGDWMTDVIRRLRGHHEPQEEVVFHEILRLVPPEATMLELGGFWSYYSLWFKSQHGITRKSYVVEPDPYYIAVGRRNAALNSIDVIFVNACVGGEQVSTRPFNAESAGLVHIPQISIEAFLKDYQIQILNILHCDTQGMETEVIRSSEILFRNKVIRFAVFSTHHHSISGDPLTHQRCLSMLQDFGGRILIEHDVHESYSGDGLIAAYFGDEPINWSEPHVSLNRYSTSLFRNPLYDLSERS
jgi:FkbM family methyltransferase